MSGLFIAILNMSFAGSIAVLIVLAVRFLMNIGRLPGRYAYLLWAIPGIRLLWPFIPEAGFSLFPAAGKTDRRKDHLRGGAVCRFRTAIFRHSG